MVLNQTATASAQRNKYSVWRYWRSDDPYNSWVKSELLFTSSAWTEFYEDFDLFDDYAIGYRDKEFYVIYWKEAIAGDLPSNFEMRAYDFEGEADVVTYSFYDRSDGKGQFELMVFLPYPAAIQLKKVTMEIDPVSWRHTFTTLDDSQFDG